MIWVILDHHIATGTHEFADSANNGPWGAALTTEAIPALEAEYRMDARASGRFLNGHSSGGWSTLWLQVAYPKVFGRSEAHTSELQSLMRNQYAVLCLKTKNQTH